MTGVGQTDAQEWCSRTDSERVVARETDKGILLLWGEFEGKYLHEIPHRYVRYLLSGSALRHIPLSLQAAVKQWADLNGLPTTYYSTEQPGHIVAHVDPHTKLLVLDFGKHRGSALYEVPTHYLRWLVQSCESDFLP